MLFFFSEARLYAELPDEPHFAFCFIPVVWFCTQMGLMNLGW